MNCMWRKSLRNTANADNPILRRFNSIANLIEIQTASKSSFISRSILLLLFTDASIWFNATMLHSQIYGLRIQLCGVGVARLMDLPKVQFINEKGIERKLILMEMLTRKILNQGKFGGENLNTHHTIDLLYGNLPTILSVYHCYRRCCRQFFCIS